MEIDNRSNNATSPGIKRPKEPYRRYLNSFLIFLYEVLYLRLHMSVMSNWFCVAEMGLLAYNDLNLRSNLVL